MKLQDKYPDILDAFPNIEWSDIRGMRNRLVHAYVDANLQVVWTTVTMVLPELVREIEAKTS